jgi:hypothetical protein
MIDKFKVVLIFMILACGCARAESFDANKAAKQYNNLGRGIYAMQKSLVLRCYKDSKKAKDQDGLFSECVAKIFTYTEMP